LSNLKTLRGGRTLTALALGAIIGLALIVAGSAAGSKATHGSAKAAPLVALLLPENVTPRWEGFDHPTFVKALKKLVPGVKIDVVNAVNDPAKQQSQAEAEITKGAKVLVVGADDGKAFGTVARKAIAQGVKVIAYDRLISGAKISSYISFDGVSVGKAQGKWLALHTKKGSRIAIINGATTDNNAHLFNKGYMSVLNPLFRKGLRTRVGPAAGTWTPGWDPPTAQKEMEQLLTKSNNGIDAVLSANDGMAGGIIAALKAQGMKLPVTGQDASLEGVQNIILGTQGMSVFKDFRKQAPAAAAATAALLKGKTKLPGANQKVANGSGKLIPSIILPVVSIDKSNLSLLVKNGYAKAFLGGLKGICKGMPKTSICK
jgi:D-xylose transport system substrate-binding protein